MLYKGDFEPSVATGDAIQNKSWYPKTKTPIISPGCFLVVIKRLNNVTHVKTLSDLKRIIILSYQLFD